jgi:hypothetical protein
LKSPISAISVAALNSPIPGQDIKISISCLS